MLAGHVGKYSRYEIEKKYLLEATPKDLPSDFVDIHDKYLPNSSLRLRIERAPDGKIIGRKLTKKDPAPDQDSATCVITSLYLSEEDLKALGNLTGHDLHKRRYYREYATNRVSFDVFLGKLEGLVLAEVEFLDHAPCTHFKPTDPGWKEVTGDPKYSGGYLATQASWSDEEFLVAFENCKIPKIEWTHRSHVRMAWLYLRKHSPEVALPLIRDGIRRYNAATGGPANGYHETVTCAYIRLVHERMRRQGRTTTWDDFAGIFPELFDRASPLTLRHYRRETILSDQARATFVEPDLEPLP